MHLSNIELEVRRLFIELNSALKEFQPWRKYAKTAPDNQKLKSSASRITVPTPFDPYVKIIESTTDFRFTGDIKISIDDVKIQDKEVLSNYSHKNFDYSKLKTDTLIRAAWSATTELLIDQIGLHEMNLHDSARSFPGSSSACYPIYGRKDGQLQLDQAVNFASEYLDSKEPDTKHLFSLITTLFHRYQYKVGSDNIVNKKVRPIWGIPFGFSVIEGYFFRDLVDNIPKRLKAIGSTVSSLGLNLPEISDNIISKFRLQSSDLISLDLKSFDSTVPSFMWALFFSCLCQCYHCPLEKKKHFVSLMFYYCYTPYVYFSDDIRYQRKGTPSGCLITALFNTWVNRTIINYAYLIITDNEVLPGQDLCVLGDDNLLPSNIVSFNTLVNIYSLFGMTVNKEKSDIVKPNSDIPFLGYIWDSRNRATQTRNWYITHLCLPSSFAINLDIPVSLYQTYRAISVCLPLYNGYDMFMKLIGFRDFVFKDLYNQFKTGKDPIIRYITNDKRFQNITFPLSLFIKGNWRDRSRTVTTELD